MMFSKKSFSRRWAKRAVVVFSLALLCAGRVGAVEYGDSAEYEASREQTSEDGSGKASIGTSHEANLEAKAEGTEASFDASLAGDVNASAEKRWGNEDFGAGGGVDAKAEYLLGAEGKAGAWMDKEGIHFGAEGEAGALVSAEAELSFEATVFGVTTEVTGHVAGSAGASANAEATATIKYDGTVEVNVGAGASVGLGATAGMSFSVDAEELMAALDLDDMDELVAYLEDFVEDPGKVANKLGRDAAGELGDRALQAAKNGVNNVKDGAVYAAAKTRDAVADAGNSIWNGIKNTFSGGSSDSDKTDDSSDRPELLTAGQMNSDFSRASASYGAGTANSGGGEGGADMGLIEAINEARESATR
ncbi:MAG: hypothetical protein ACQEQC_06095 [Elusimicrobiota bacterium]